MLRQGARSVRVAAIKRFLDVGKELGSVEAAKGTSFIKLADRAIVEDDNWRDLLWPFTAFPGFE